MFRARGNKDESLGKWSWTIHLRKYRIPAYWFEKSSEKKNKTTEVSEEKREELAEFSYH